VLEERRGIYKTTDGGKNWTQCDIYAEAECFYNLQFINDRIGWFSTNRGEIFYTDDGGDIWRMIGTIEDKKVISLFFLDSKNGWAGFYEEGLSRTTDGGNTWSTDNTSGFSYIVFISFINKNTGFIGCHRMGLYYTNDGGKNWNKLFDNVLWNDMYYFNNEKIIVSGGGLDLFNFNNLTAKKIIEYNNMYALNAVDFADYLHGWTVGNFGTILHTSDGGEMWEKQMDRKFGWITDMHFLLLKNFAVGHTVMQVCYLNIPNIPVPTPIIFPWKIPIFLPFHLSYTKTIRILSTIILP